MRIIPRIHIHILILNRKIAENIINPNLSAKFTSINACAKALKADRSTLRLYLQGKSKKI